MSKDNTDSNKVSRRSLLRKTAGAGIGVAALPQTVAAWEPASTEEVTRLSNSPEIQSILDALNQSNLPNTGETRKQQINGHGEVKTTRVKFDYGTLRFGELGNERNATFRFNNIGHPDVPSKYKDVPEGTDPILIANKDDVSLNREATEQEKDAALTAIPEVPEQNSVYTESGLNGFYVDAVNNITDSEEFQLTEYLVRFQNSKVYPAVNGSNNQLDRGRNLSSSVEFEQMGIASKLIGDYVKGVIASNVGDELHECGSSCAGCADAIISLALDCRLCGPVCTSASTGVGAVICAACVYQFCNNIGGMIDCADCIACAIDGNSSWNNPTTPDIPEDIPGL